MRFEIICTGWNCESYVAKCVKSVLKQKEDFHLHLISDGSTDGTAKELRKFKGRENISVHIYKENLGAAYRRVQAIRPLNDDNVCILLGMDDEMLPNCLTRIKQEYDAGKWMTYGNWKDQNGKMLPHDFELEFSELEHQNRDYRRVKYRSTAPNTFKKFLFNNIPDEDFKVFGKWMDNATETELMFSCLEMSGKRRIGVIKEPIYLYNRGRNDNTVRKFGMNHKMAILNEVMSRPKKPLLP